MPQENPDKSRILISGDWLVGIGEAEQTLARDYQAETIALDELKPRLTSGDYDLLVLSLSSRELANEPHLVYNIRQANDQLPIVVVSDNENWEPAVKLIKLGVCEYVHVPFGKEKFRQMVAQHLKLYQMTQRIFLLKDGGNAGSPFQGMVGVSEKMRENFKVIQAVAKSNATVLITGESGTGKELVAKAIHSLSSRTDFRFIDLNCGAIPRDLLENELFGHEKGAFTGAHKRYQGSFEAAHQGSLFLDEISEMDPLLQVKLLRVLQERSFMRIGGNEKIDVDVRIMAATNRGLQESIERGQFREDLFYRLNVVNIHVPALRERRDDIPLLAMHFLEYYTAKNNRIFIDFANEAMEAMINYDWPGNVRELENTVERVVVLHNDSQVKLKCLPKHIQKVSRSIAFSDSSREMVEETKVIPLDDLERRAIELALLKCHGNISIAARKLKIGQATLYRKVKKFGLQTTGS